MKRLVYACLIVLAFVASTQIASAQLAYSSWPKFHRDCANTGQGIFSAPGSELSWTFSAGGAIKSSPVIGADGTVYVTSDDGCLYALTGGGVKLWSTNEPSCNGSSSPAVGYDGTIYVPSGYSFIYAYNPDGSRKWRRTAPGQITTSINIGPNGNLFFGCANGAVCAYTTEGFQAWSYPASGKITSTPVVASDGTVYFGCQSALYALNPSGTFKWKYQLPEGGSISAAPAMSSDGTLYIGSNTGYFYAVRNNGTLKWRAIAGGGISSSAVVTTGGVIYFGCQDGKLYAYSTGGTKLWECNLGSAIDSSPAAASDGSVCVGSDAGTIYCISASGVPLWQHDAGSLIYSSPAIGPAGALFIGSNNGTLFCFSADKTPPLAPMVADDGNYTSTLDRLHGTWSATDPDSGIYKYECCVGTAPGLDDVAPWRSVGSATQQIIQGLALQDKQTYFISVRATNGAGIVGPSASSNGIIADATPPTTPGVIDDGIYTSDYGSLHASWSSADPESGVVKYYFSVGTTPGGTNLIPWTDAGLNTSIFKTDLGLSNGVAYYINVKALNGGGAYSAVGSSDGITVDFTPPDMPIVTDDGQFISDLHSIHAEWQCNDAESGITKYEYSVGTTRGGTEIKTWTSAGLNTEAVITGITLTNGGTYYVNVRATNGVGLVSSVSSSDGAILDNTPPSTPVVTDDGKYTGSTTELHASWTSSDSESGIKTFRYAVGTSAGAADVVSWTDAGMATTVTLKDLVLANKKTYYFSVVAVNGASAESQVGMSDGITVETTPPDKPVVTDDGDVTVDHSQLHATWTSKDDESGISKYEYSIGSSAGATDVVDWTDVGTATSVTKTGLGLTDGIRYYINVRATNPLGLVSEVGSSDGILVDSTPPPAPTVTDDGSFTSSLDTLHFAWTAVTSTSPVKSYEYSIGTAAGQTDARGWTDAGLVTEFTATGLTLQTGKSYFVNVRAINSVGKTGSVGSSNGILADATAPVKPTVTDGGAYASSATDLTASWSSSDPESGVTLYEYAVGTTAGGTNTRAWTSVGTQTSLTITGLSLVDGGSYYISVRATNGAGLKSLIGSSDGIIVDLSAPSKPTVTDDGAYTTNGTQLHATWSSSDAQSGIAKYEYSIGISAGATDTLGWTSAGTAVEKTITGLSLKSGSRYYINVRATNGAGMLSQIGSSDGILVDATPPTTPAVTDGGKYTRSTTTLQANWSSQDPETGITGYEYSIGTSAGATNLIGWSSAGTATNIYRADLNLTNGATYYFNVRATNGVGLVSSVGSSDGITVDTTPPPAPTVTDDGTYTANTTQLHAKLACNDPESGAASYEYAVGTTPLGTDIVNWKADGAGPDITITGLSLQTGITYYISARATNGAGMVGDPGTSDGIKVDNTLPVGLAVTDDGDYTGSNNSLHGSWTASDPESGIAKYRYCIGTTAGSNNIADWLEVGSAVEHTRTGLSLTTGQIYYITVIAVNGAGGSSAPVSSNGIRVDLSAPTTPVVTDTGIYWGYKTSLGASWTSQDPESGIAEYEVSAGTSAGATDVAPWQSAGKVTSFTIKSIHLNDGVTYYFNVRAKNGAGKWSAVGSSDGVVIDSTPPTLPVIVDDGDTTTVLDRLHAAWHSSDPESGIAEYVYCIGTSPGGTDVVGWTSAGTREDVTVTELKLDPVLRYYFSVKARSGSGAWSPIGCSDGIGFTSGAAIWWRFRNDLRNNGRGLFNATLRNDLGWKIQTQNLVESSAAIAADGTTYIGSADGKVYAITQNGTLRWTCDLGASITSSPAIANDGRICIGCDNGKVYCLSNAGVVQWSYSTGSCVHSSPLIRSDVVYAGSLDGSLYAINLDSGLKAWSCPTGGSIWSSPAVDPAGVIYVGSEDQYLYAINPGGAKKWRFPTGSAVVASPAIGSDGAIYIGSGSGIFYAINPDGTQKWQFTANSSVNSSAAITADGTIYFGTGYETSDGRLYALRSDGTEAWHISIPKGAILSSPAVDPSGTIYVGACDKKMHAYKSDATPVWEFATGDSIASSPALGADGSVVFGSYDGAIYCLRDASSKDLTPPTTPVVTVPSAVIAEGDPIQASWTATDPESMVAEYTYAIGTTPGGTEISGWTSTGIEKSTLRDDIVLRTGQSYYVSVKARNPSQRWSEIGVSRKVMVASEVSISSIGVAKSYSDGDSVSLVAKVVTAVFGDCFFVEEADRSAGIRCIQAGVSLLAGDRVDVSGTIATINGERVVTGCTHAVAGAGEQVKPLGISSIMIKRPCPDFLGLKATIWGRVTAAGDGYFIVNDGGKFLSPKGVKGIEVWCQGTPTSVGKYVAVTGVLCREISEGQAVIVMRMPSPDALNTFE